jgi:Na+/proline symporter
MGGEFRAIDWAVVGGLLVFTTWLGHRLSGRQASMRDFFLAGRRLPWWAVAASIVATEISAVTFIGLPATVYAGDLRYLQIVLLGSLVSRSVVALWLVPAYYRREIYSPYDFVGERLGEGARRVTTGLFSLGGVLGQAARVYMTALILEVLLREELAALREATGVPPLVAAVAAIAAVSVLWTWMGGIAAVVWTDGILFLLFVGGAAAALATIHGEVAGGLPAAFDSARAAGKLRLLDPTFDLADPFTLASAVLGAGWGMVAAYGVDQLMVQRVFCCRGPGEARKAVLASYSASVVVALVAFVGVGLWAYYAEHPLEGEAAALVEEKGDRIFPVFVLQVIPSPLKGLILAGAFAAAISSLDSILAALSQTTVALLRPRGDAEVVRTSRLLVLGWGVALAAAAVAIEGAAERYGDVLNLALAMQGFAGGALLAAFALAYWRPGGIDGRGFAVSGPLSVLFVLASAWHERWALATIFVGWAFLYLAWDRTVGRELRARGATAARRWRSLLLVASVVAASLLCTYGWVPRIDDEGHLARASLAWPWYVPLGSTVAFALGVALAPPREGVR